VEYFTIALTNALIIDVALRTHESHDPTPTKGFEYEEIKLTCQKIERTWNDGGITATDSWAACI
jgi:type VI secretion system Hcp family effector